MKGVYLAIAVGLIGFIGSRSEGLAVRYPDAFIEDRIAKVRFKMREEDWIACKKNAPAEQYVRADFWFEEELIPDVGVRPKGHSSLHFVAAMGSSRFSFKVDFNLFNKARNFRGLKKLNLNNGFGDPTLIRERLGYELFEEMGLPTPRLSFIDLWINENHMGLYTMVEHIDKTFLERHFNRRDGNLYKPEPPGCSLKWTEKTLQEQRKKRGKSGRDELKSALDVNLGGGKLREIMHALGQPGLADDNTPTPMPVLVPPGMAPPPVGGDFMEDNDSNNDGKVSEEEFIGPSFIFSRFDKDGDGYIVESEAPKGPPPGSPPGMAPSPMGGNFMADKDSNDDGKVSKEEFDVPPFIFSRFDKDGDGYIIESEAPRGPPPDFPPGMGRFPGKGLPPGGPFPPGLGSFRSGDYLESMGLKTNENSPDHSSLFRFLEILNNEPDESFPDEIEKVLNIDQVLRFFAVSTAIVHLDNYTGLGHNYYLYEIDGKFTIIPWDLNMAFGTFNCFGKLDYEAIVNLPIDEPTCSPIEDLPLLNRLLSHSQYLDTYHGYLESLLEGPFDNNKLASRIDELARLLRPLLDSDELKFFSTTAFEKGLNDDISKVHKKRIFPIFAPSLKPFVMERNESIKRQLEAHRLNDENNTSKKAGHGL